MELNENLTKLKALRKLLKSWLQYHHRYFDPQNTLDIFSRFSKIRNNLKKEYPRLFDDLPIRKIPKPSNTTDFEGRGYIKRDHFEILLRDIDYCLNILSNKPTLSIKSIEISSLERFIFRYSCVN